MAIIFSGISANSGNSDERNIWWACVAGYVSNLWISLKGWIALTNFFAFSIWYL